MLGHGLVWEREKLPARLSEDQTGWEALGRPVRGDGVSESAALGVRLQEEQGSCAQQPGSGWLGAF